MGDTVDMPDDLSFLDQLEEWLEAQVPQNFHEFPLRMLETMERMSNELCEHQFLTDFPRLKMRLDERRGYR